MLGGGERLMSTNNERCLDPWHGFFIILAVCIVILGGIFNEFQGGTHHGRIHAKAHAPMTQAGFINSGNNVQPPAGEITF